MARYLFLNASANHDGETAQAGASFMEDLDARTLHLVDYRIGFFGQHFPDDEYDTVFDAVLEAETILLGTPIYTNTMSAAARTFLERLETHPRAKELAGRSLIFFIHGFDANKNLVDSTTASVTNAIEPQGMRFLGTASDIVELAELHESLS